MTHFMTSAKNSFGLDALEMETDFLTMTAATPHVLASTVNTVTNNFVFKYAIVSYIH